MSRIFLLFIFFEGLLLKDCNGQNKNDLVIKYYDSSWIATSPKLACYECKIIKVNNLYNSTCYYTSQNTIESKTTYVDSFFSKKIGLDLEYYKNGQIKDSSFYNNLNKLVYEFHYYENGVLKDSIKHFENGDIEAKHYYSNALLFVNYKYDKNLDKEIILTFDSTTYKPINDFVYSKEAVYPKGDKEWAKYIGKELRPTVPIKRGANPGAYTVIIRFELDMQGSIINVRPETNLGFGMEDEAIRVIKKSKKWTPAIWLNKNVMAYRRQPITFVIQKE